MALRIGIENSELTSHKPVARILIAEPKADDRGQRKGEGWENKPNRINRLYTNNIRHKWEKQTQMYYL